MGFFMHTITSAVVLVRFDPISETDPNNLDDDTTLP
jgi:hypothetical protein